MKKSNRQNPWYCTHTHTHTQYNLTNRNISMKNALFDIYARDG